MNARDVLGALGRAGAALAVGVWSSSGSGRDLDRTAFAALNRTRGPGADLLARGVTELGSIWASAAAAAVLAVSGRRGVAVRAFSAASATWLAGQGLKRAFGRPRPYDSGLEGSRLLIDRPRASSWPSSHPAVLVAFTTVAGRALGVGRPGRAALDALGLVVAVSRSYVGVHYPADTLGGLLVGKAVAAAWGP